MSSANNAGNETTDCRAESWDRAEPQGASVSVGGHGRKHAQGSSAHDTPEVA